jgi:hypothetical protein
MDRFWLIGVLTAPQKVCPHGYEKSPCHVDYSSKFLKLVGVREVPSSNLGTPTEGPDILVDDKDGHPRDVLY